jgi:hypothetical protein
MPLATRYLVPYSEHTTLLYNLLWCFVNKRYRKPTEQSRMDNCQHSLTQIMLGRVRQVVCLFDGVLRHFQQYFSYTVVVSFIGGGKWRTRRKPPTCHKSLTNFIS